MNIDRPMIFINPVFSEQSAELIELWDDCMSFPDLLVRLRRHRSLRITYRDLNWGENTQRLEGDLAELLQHEVDHLDGILAVMRAIDGASYALQSQRRHLNLTRVANLTAG
jgi:peptide deformylase